MYDHYEALIFDMDNDGNKDLFVANGTTYDYLNYDFYVYFYTARFLWIDRYRPLLIRL